jgi:hypothetical protein
MKSQNMQTTFSISCDEYKNIDTQKISKIFLKNGDIFEIKNNMKQENYYENEYLNTNVPISSRSCSSINDLAKLRKFNSYSTNVKGSNNEFKGFYVIPISDNSKRMISIKVPDYDSVNYDNHHVDSFSFRASPKKYSYKPYKPPKRKSILKTDTSPVKQTSKYSKNYNGKYKNIK